MRIAGADLKGKEQLRKERFLVPLNSNYDLYSNSKDGASKAPLQTLRGHRCNEFQGNLISKPLPAREFEALLAQNVRPIPGHHEIGAITRRA